MQTQPRDAGIVLQIHRNDRRSARYGIHSACPDRRRLFLSLKADRAADRFKRHLVHHHIKRRFLIHRDRNLCFAGGIVLCTEGEHGCISGSGVILAADIVPVHRERHGGQIAAGRKCCAGQDAAVLCRNQLQHGCVVGEGKAQ